MDPTKINFPVMACILVNLLKLVPPAKMHQIRFRLGLRRRPAHSDSYVFEGSTSKRRERGRGEREREKVKGREGEMVWREGLGPTKKFGVAPLTPDR